MFEHKKVAIVLVISISTIIGACSKSKAPANQPANPPTAQQQVSQSIETEIVNPQTITGAINATGKIAVPEDRMAVIGPVNSGRLVKLYAGQGSRVKKGQKLAELESSDIDQAESDYLKAQADVENARRTAAAEVKLAQETYDRTKALYEKTIVPGKNLQSAEHDLEVAKANAESSAAQTRAALIAARRRLLVLGMKESDIDALSKRPNLTATFALNSPIDGIVIERNATIGATVDPDTNVFKIVDTSHVWIDANVFEKDLDRVRSGQQVKLTVPAFPGTTFVGRVIFISTVLDSDTRSVKVRTEVANPDGRLKPEMFANVEIVTDMNRTAISIPESAVLDDGGKSIVFVAENNGYQKRVVTAGIRGNNRVEIIDGLRAGDHVVTKGNYLLLQQSKGNG